MTVSSFLNANTLARYRLATSASLARTTSSNFEQRHTAAMGDMGHMHKQIRDTPGRSDGPLPCFRERPPNASSPPAVASLVAARNTSLVVGYAVPLAHRLRIIVNKNN